MSTILKKTQANIKIGELLVQAGMLTQTQLAEAVRHAGGKRLQLGQILVMYGYLKAADLQAALDAQSMIRDRAIDIDLALRCLKVAYKTAVPFVEVLAEHEGRNVSRAPTSKLGELLLESGLITTEQFARAMQRSLTTGLPLGRMLVLNQDMSEGQLSQALEIQVRLRDEMIGREEALAALKATAAPEQIQENVEHNQQAPVKPPSAPRRRGVRLGELMVLAGVITETDVMNALEVGLLNDKPIGEVLAERGLVTQALIDAALELQKRIDSGELSIVKAAECLARIRSAGCSIDEAVVSVRDDLSPEKTALSYEKLLTLAKVCSGDDIESAFDLSSKSPQIIGRVLLLTGFIDEPTMQATLRCHQLLARGWISQDDAIASLHFCLRQKDERGINFDDALRELGWQANKPLALEDEDRQTKVSTTDLIANVNAAAEADANAHADATATGNGAETNGNKVRKTGKHTETIAPEDPNARNLAAMVKQQVSAEKAAKINAGRKSLAESFSQLAMSYYEQGKFNESQLLYERILVHRLKKVGPNHLDLIPDLRNLAGVLCAQGKFNQAEAFMRRVVAIGERQPVPDALELADGLSILGGIYFYQAKHAEAEAPFARALELRRARLASDNPDLIESMMDYAKVLKKLDRDEESEKLYEEARAAGR